MNGGYARRKYFRHITAGCTNFTAPICMDVRMLILYSLSVGGGYALRCAVGFDVCTQ